MSQAAASTGVKADNNSIFASADYFKDAPTSNGVENATETLVDTVATKAASSPSESMMFMDANDTLGTTMAFATKDIDNLVQGI